MIPQIHAVFERPSTEDHRSLLRAPGSRSALLLATVLCLVTFAYAKIYDAPFIWDDRKLIVANPGVSSPGNVLESFYKPFWRVVLKRAKVICVSNPNYIQTSDYLRPHAAKCRVIPHGAELGQFAPTPEIMARAAAIRAEAGAPIVFFAGLLRYYKGAQYLIEAMAQVPGAKLLIAGAVQ